MKIESADAKSKRMSKLVTERIEAAREAAADVYGVVKPATEHQKARAEAKARGRTPKAQPTP